MPDTVTIPAEIATQFSALHRLVGNTPLLAVDVRYRGQSRRIYAKHESLSLTDDRARSARAEIANRVGRASVLLPSRLAVQRATPTP